MLMLASPLLLPSEPGIILFRYLTGLAVASVSISIFVKWFSTVQFLNILIGVGTFLVLLSICAAGFVIAVSSFLTLEILKAIGLFVLGIIMISMSITAIVMIANKILKSR